MMPARGPKHIIRARSTTGDRQEGDWEPGGASSGRPPRPRWGRTWSTGGHACHLQTAAADPSGLAAGRPNCGPYSSATRQPRRKRMRGGGSWVEQGGWQWQVMAHMEARPTASPPGHAAWGKQKHFAKHAQKQCGIRNSLRNDIFQNKKHPGPTASSQISPPSSWSLARGRGWTPLQTAASTWKTKRRYPACSREPAATEWTRARGRSLS